jgi:hypothetical protein
MVSGLRLFVAAALFAAIAIVDMHAFAGNGNSSEQECSSSVQFVAFRRAGGETDSAQLRRFYKDRWERRLPDFCTDEGQDCTHKYTLDNPQVSDPSLGRILRVSGGFLVTVPMVATEVYMTDGTSLGVATPWPGRTVERNERTVRLVSAPTAEELSNVVVDFTGCIVDQDLNVTKFVAVR